MPPYRLILASASPARRAILTAAGIPAEVIVSRVDESAVQAPDAATLSGTLAVLKARDVTATLTRGHPGRTLVIGCDSVLEFDGEIHGKPADAAEAVARWRRMRGRSGVLYTGHCLIDADSGKQAAATAATAVHLADVSDAEIAAYVATGEPLRVAGAFTLDGIGGPFVTRIEGDPGTVIGLSLPLLRTLLAEHGISITELWRPATAGNGNVASAGVDAGGAASA